MVRHAIALPCFRENDSGHLVPWLQTKVLFCHEFTNRSGILDSSNELCWMWPFQFNMDFFLDRKMSISHGICFLVELSYDYEA